METPDTRELRSMIQKLEERLRAVEKGDNLQMGLGIRVDGTMIALSEPQQEWPMPTKADTHLAFKDGVPKWIAGTETLTINKNGQTISAAGVLETTDVWDIPDHTPVAIDTGAQNQDIFVMHSWVVGGYLHILWGNFYPGSGTTFTNDDITVRAIF